MSFRDMMSLRESGSAISTVLAEVNAAPTEQSGPVCPLFVCVLDAPRAQSCPYSLTPCCTVVFFSVAYSLSLTPLRATGTKASVVGPPFQAGNPR